MFVRPNVELTGPMRQDGLARLAKMHRVPPTGPSWPAVAGPVERRVSPHCTARDERALVSGGGLGSSILGQALYGCDGHSSILRARHYGCNPAQVLPNQERPLTDCQAQHCRAKR